MPEILVVGEALVDVVSTATGTQAHPGGSPLNVAVGLARLGAAVTLATRIGTDASGKLLTDHLREAGVRLAPDSVAPSARTSSATARIRTDGSAEYDFDITWNLAAVPIQGFDVLHTGSIGALLAPGGPNVATGFEASGTGVLRSFDPNIRPSVIGARDAVLPLVERFARTSTVVKMSDEDAEWLHPELDPLDVTAHYARLGAPLVVITRGAEGSLLRCGAETSSLPPTPARVVDTIGAGDSYMAGLLHRLSTTVSADALSIVGLSLRDAEDACRFAAACAAVTVSRAGADLPHRDEVVDPAPIRYEGESR